MPLHATPTIVVSGTARITRNDEVFLLEENQSTCDDIVLQMETFSGATQVPGTPAYVAPEVIKRLDQEHADRADFRAIGRVIAPWGRRIGDLRFESEGAWKRSGTTVDSLAKELKLALQYPEGAAV